MNFKFNRQLSNREMFLIWVLAFVAFSAGLINYFLLPNYDAYKVEKSNINYLQKNSDIKEIEYEKIPIYNKSINQSLASIELSLREIPAKLYEDETMVLLNLFAKNSGMEVSTYIFAPIQIVPFNEWTQNDEIPPIEMEDSFVVIQKTELSMHGTYDDLIGFLKEIENFNQKMYVDHLAITSDDNNKIYANISINRMGYFDKEIYDNTVMFHSVKSEGYGEHMFLKLEDNTVEEEVKSYHPLNHVFSLIINDSKSVAPKIIMRATNNESSQIFLDRKKVTEGKLEIYEEEEKISYHYTIDEETFAGSLENSNVERMDFNVYSCQRQENDSIGILFSVDNKTNIPFVVHVYNEDEKQPRFTIKDLSGNVRMEKKHD